VDVLERVLGGWLVGRNEDRHAVVVVAAPVAAKSPVRLPVITAPVAQGLVGHDLAGTARQIRRSRREADGGHRMSHDLRFAQVIDAPPGKVFAALTEQRGQEALYGRDDPSWIVQSECDLRVGGVWKVEFGPNPGDLYRHTHVFQVIDPPRRLLLSTTETRLDGSSFDTENRIHLRRPERQDPHDDDPTTIPDRRAPR
jgi:hypothetical protein